MAVKLRITEGTENATLTLRTSPGLVSFAGSEEIRKDIEFESQFAYNSVGHKFTLASCFAMDLYIFMVDLFDAKNVEILEGQEQIKADDKELGIIEKTGVS